MIITTTSTEKGHDTIERDITFAFYFVYHKERGAMREEDHDSE